MSLQFWSRGYCRLWFPLFAPRCTQCEVPEYVLHNSTFVLFGSFQAMETEKSHPDARQGSVG